MTAPTPTRSPSRPAVRPTAVDALVIGGGQAGLAMSHALSRRGIDHVVLERGRVGERWRSERWDSLRLLTPNWLNGLPGLGYDGDDPDGYMAARELVDYFERYRAAVGAPVQDHTTVLSVDRIDGGYAVRTDRGDYRARSVVIATGQCDRPHVPTMAQHLDPSIAQLTPSRYRSASQLDAGGVLVVGASATGVQLADEIAASGRAVTLAVGRHTRMPRRYRGRDILYWLHHMGVLGRSADHVRDLGAERAEPSLQLVGRRDQRDLDLGVLARAGVRLTGRLCDLEGTAAHFAEDLPRRVQQAQDRLSGLIARVDAFAEDTGLALEEGAAPQSIDVGAAPRSIDLRAEGISTVLWATGYRRSYPWLRVPVLDGRGEIRHDSGVTASPGLYVLGLSFLSRRDSSFIGGVGHDANSLSSYVQGHLAGYPAAA